MSILENFFLKIIVLLMKKVIMIYIAIIIVKYAQRMKLDASNVRIIFFLWIQKISNIKVVTHHTCSVIQKAKTIFLMKKINN